MTMWRRHSRTTRSVDADAQVLKALSAFKVPELKEFCIMVVRMYQFSIVFFKVVPGFIILKARSQNMISIPVNR